MFTPYILPYPCWDKLSHAISCLFCLVLSLCISLLEWLKVCLRECMVDIYIQAILYTVRMRLDGICCILSPLLAHFCCFWLDGICRILSTVYRIALLSIISRIHKGHISMLICIDYPIVCGHRTVSFLSILSLLILPQP